MLGRVGQSSKKTLPGKNRRRSDPREVKPQPEPIGKKSPKGQEGCVWDPEARQALGGRGSGCGPRPASGCAPGPSSRRRLTSPPSRRHGPGWRPVPGPPGPLAPVWDFRFQWQRSPPLHRLWVSAPRPGIPSLQDPHPEPAVLLPTRRLYLLLASTPGLWRPVRNSEPRVGVQPFPAATALSRAALGPSNTSGRGIGGRESRDERPARRHCRSQSSCRKAASQLTTARGRAGGRPNGEGSRGVRNGCHVAQVDHRPPPPPSRLAPPTPPATSGSSPGSAMALSLAQPGHSGDPGPRALPPLTLPQETRVPAWWALPHRTRSLLPPKEARGKAIRISPFPCRGGVTWRTKRFSLRRVFE